MIKMNQLMHNGIYIPKSNHEQGLKVYVRGEPFKLTTLQEQMAIAWVKKLETPYAEDEVFVHNFFEDFIKTFNIDPNIDFNEFDFSEVIAYLQEEKRKKESLSKDEIKRLREERKKNRGNLRERFGYAYVDGERIPIANYVAEPSSIFVGRGNHPLRGRWKEGPKQRDVTLNLSPEHQDLTVNGKKLFGNPMYCGLLSGMINFEEKRSMFGYQTLILLNRKEKSENLIELVNWKIT